MANGSLPHKPTRDGCEIDDLSGFQDENRSESHSAMLWSPRKGWSNGGNGTRVEQRTSSTGNNGSIGRYDQTGLKPIVRVLGREITRLPVVSRMVF